MVVDLASLYPCKSFNDILFGIPVCKSKLQAIQKLKNKLESSTNGDGDVHVLVDHPDQVNFLEDFIRNTPFTMKKWSVFLKLDTGYHRAGTSCDDRGVMLAMKIIESPFVALKGLYSHW